LSLRIYRFSEEPALPELLVRFWKAIHRDCLTAPPHQLVEPIHPCDPGRKAQELARSAGVRGTVAHITPPKLAGDGRLDPWSSGHLRQRARHVLDLPWHTTPDVDHLSVGRGGFNRRKYGVHHVVDRHEVAGLTPILVNNRRLARQESAQENGEDARVRVTEGLPRSVDIKHPETDHREVIDRAEAQGQLFLIPLRQGIDVLCEKGGFFGREDGLQQFRRLGTDWLPS
jgi:hypothetical protein